MSLVSLGDLAQSFILRRNTALVKHEVQSRSQEMTTGMTSDIARHLRGDLGALNGVTQSLSQLSGYKAVTTEMDLYATTMQTALQSIDGFATNLATPLLSAAIGGDDSTIDAIGAEARQKFSAAIGLLNTRVGDRALFSGKATDRAPLPDGETILAQIETLVSGQVTAEDVRDTLNNWFDDPAGYQALYAGSGPLAAVEIGQGETAHIRVTAMSPGVVETLKGLALAALVGKSSTSLDQQGRATLGVMAGQSLLDSQGQRADMRAHLAVTENRIAAAQTRNNAENTALELARGRLVEVDAYEAATRLTEAQTRLETIYAITARLSALNLTSYLR